MPTESGADVASFKLFFMNSLNSDKRVHVILIYELGHPDSVLPCLFAFFTRMSLARKALTTKHYISWLGVMPDLFMMIFKLTSAKTFKQRGWTRASSKISTW